MLLWAVRMPHSKEGPRFDPVLVYLKFSSQVSECTTALHWSKLQTPFASDGGLISVLVLFDLSAVFDTTEHHILLQR